MNSKFTRLTLKLLTLSMLAFGAQAQNHQSQKHQSQNKRIISAGSTVTELFFALGVQDELVAVDLTSRHFIGNGAQQAELSQVGYHRQLSAEGLMALKPTHLIGSEEMGPESTLTLLEASQVSIINMPAGNEAEVLNKRIDLIADLTGSQQQAKRLKQQVSASIQQLKMAQNTNVPQPRVLFLMLSKDRPANVAGANTSINEAIMLSGAINPAAAQLENYKPLSFEAIIALQPDYILVSERAWQSFGSKEAIIKQLPLLAATPAGQKAQIIAVPSSAIIGGFGLASLKLAQDLQQTFKMKAEK